MSMKSISESALASMRHTYTENDKARVVRNALVKNDVSTISRVFEAENANPNIFSVDLKTMPVTNQLQSGRCWIFSAMNVLREKIGHKYDIKEFELSQNFIAFYDKLEKANWFMGCVENELDSDLNSPELRYLLDFAVGDGGQWNMLVSIVRKYGLCPKDAMKETYSSSHTRNMNGILNQRLRRFAADARRAAADGDRDKVNALHEQALSEIYGLLADCFGLPPKEFTFAYRDSKDEYHVSYHVTPLQFYQKYLGEDLEDFISVINGPTADKPYHHVYTVKYLGNIADGSPVRLLNVPMDELKQGIIDMLEDGQPVWFGCDCGKDGDRESGLWDDRQYDYANTFDMNLDMSKADMLDYRQSAMNHAMVITGVNLDENGQPDRWKIENSWGDKTANKGYFIASDSWFDKYVYVAAIEKKYLSKENQEALKEEPVVLSPWDPFGTLAD